MAALCLGENCNCMPQEVPCVQQSQSYTLYICLSVAICINCSPFLCPYQTSTCLLFCLCTGSGVSQKTLPVIGKEINTIAINAIIIRLSFLKLA